MKLEYGYQDKKNLENLYWKENMNQREIAKNFGVSQPLICFYFKKFNIKSRKKHIKYNPNFTPSKDLSFLLGALIGDGSVYKEKKTCCTIKYVSKDMLLIENVTRILKKIIGSEKGYKIYKENSLYKVKAYSKKFFDWYKSYDIIKIGMRYPKEFLCGFFEAEGGISWFSEKNKYVIHLCNRNNKLLELIKNKLDKNKIKSNIRLSYKKGTMCNFGSRKYKRNYDSYQLRIEDKESVKKFMNQIGFITERKKLKKTTFRVDIDYHMNKKQLKKFVNTRKAILQFLKYQVEETNYGKSDKKGYHFWFICYGRIKSPSDENFTQLLLNDDKGRVMINQYRINRGMDWNHMSNFFFSKVYWRRPDKYMKNRVKEVIEKSKLKKDEKELIFSYTRNLENICNRIRDMMEKGQKELLEVN